MESVTSIRGSALSQVAKRAFWSTSVTVVLAVTAAASAQGAPATDEVSAEPPSARIHMWLPDARHEAMASALRLELAARGAVVETEVGGAPAGVEPGDWRGRATHVGWVSLEGGALAGAEVVVVAVRSSRVARARVSHAWDLVEPRAVSVLVASLVDELSSDDAPSADDASSEGTRASTGSDSSPVSERASADGAGANGAGSRAEDHLEVAAAKADEPCSLCERFTFFSGIGPIWTRADGRWTRSSTLELGLYGRVSPWVSIGVRIAGGGGYSSVQGGFVDMRIAAPSVLVSRRIRLGRVLILELGVHAEGALYMDYAQHAAPESNLLSFGVSAGAILGLDFGERHGLRIDATMGVHGLGGTETATIGAATLLYVRRIGRRE